MRNKKKPKGKAKIDAERKRVQAKRQKLKANRKMNDKKELLEQAEEYLPATIHMIAACEDEQITSDCSDINKKFGFGDSKSGLNAASTDGGACTSVLLKLLYNYARNPDDNGIPTYGAIISKLRGILKNRGYKQLPQLTASRPIDKGQAEFCIVPKTDFTGNRRALVIGINYTGQKHEIPGCQNDAWNIIKYLKKFHGFVDEDITILMDDGKQTSPTRENIKRAMHRFSFSLKPGDAAFFHFSGHGLTRERITGNNQTMLPVDFMESGGVKDSEIFRLLLAPLSKGIELTAIVDCCHSGSMFDLPFHYTGEVKKAIKGKKDDKDWLNDLVEEPKETFSHTASLKVERRRIKKFKDIGESAQYIEDQLYNPTHKWVKGGSDLSTVGDHQSVVSANTATTRKSRKKKHDSLGGGSNHSVQSVASRATRQKNRKNRDSLGGGSTHSVSSAVSSVLSAFSKKDKRDSHWVTEGFNIEDFKDDCMSDDDDPTKDDEFDSRSFCSEVTGPSIGGRSNSGIRKRPSRVKHKKNEIDEITMDFGAPNEIEEITMEFDIPVGGMVVAPDESQDIQFEFDTPGTELSVPMSSEGKPLLGKTPSGRSSRNDDDLDNVSVISDMTDQSGDRTRRRRKPRGRRNRGQKFGSGDSVVSTGETIASFDPPPKGALRSSSDYSFVGSETDSQVSRRSKKSHQSRMSRQSRMSHANSIDMTGQIIGGRGSGDGMVAPNSRLRASCGGSVQSGVSGRSGVSARSGRSDEFVPSMIEMSSKELSIPLKGGSQRSHQTKGTKATSRPSYNANDPMVYKKKKNIFSCFSCFVPSSKGRERSKQPKSAL